MIFSKKIQINLIVGVTALLTLILGNKLQSQVTGTQKYTAVGTTNWTVPACVTTVTVQCWGGGGSGCSGGFGAGYNDGGGGGGGAYASSVLTVISGNVYPVVVGAGGITNCGGNTYVPGQNGGNSSF